METSIIRPPRPSPSSVSVALDVSLEFLSTTIAIAAGAILAMVTDTMIPEAFESTAGLITVLGFLASFLLSKATA